MRTPIAHKLNDLILNGLKDLNGTVWKINPYFSSNWKFMVIILGFNAPNSRYFCPWCLCTKEDIGNRQKVCIIEKTYIKSSQLFFNNNSTVKPPPGHTKPPLLQIIPLDHYILDKLYIILEYEISYRI
ncbi:hypothetical protein C1646_196067 [Rhizophagus diaphanus]|nr:hypothetical protein C1646_196067 [Rhizophagus diaphanus] [Rhizophagus sp. MUCL 43196]